MSLINNTPTSGSLNEDQKKARTAGRIKAKSTNLFRTVLNAYNDLANEVANNPDGLAPADVVAALGDDYTNYTQLGTGLKGLLNQAVPGTVPDAPAAPTPAPPTPPATS